MPKEIAAEKVGKMLFFFASWCRDVKGAVPEHSEELVEFFLKNIEQIEKAYDEAMEGKVA